MKKTILIASGFAIFLSACTSSQISNTVSTVGKVLTEDAGLSEEQVGNGLKEALSKGVSKGSDQASAVDGFFKNAMLKILIPEKMLKVESKLRSMGFDKLMDDFVLSLNRAAEDASKEAKPIFLDAVKGMSIADAWNILKGDKNAATEYLSSKTRDALYNKFKPVISNSLEKVNATKYYEKVATTYNKIPFTKEKVDTDLPDYTTNKAITGIFKLIEQEEANIRENPVARTTDLLKKVFTEDNMKKEE